MALAEYLTKDDRSGVFRRLTSRLRVDWMKLHRLLALVPGMPSGAILWSMRSGATSACQAVRLSLLMHMFLRAVQVPPFSRSNDVSRDDVLEMVLSLRVDDALAQLRRAYPVAIPHVADFSVDEPSDFPDHEGEDYGAIRARFIDPIERAHALNLRVAVAVANYFGRTAKLSNDQRARVLDRARRGVEYGARRGGCRAPPAGCGRRLDPHVLAGMRDLLAMGAVDLDDEESAIAAPFGFADAGRSARPWAGR
jgi:hypothetical protein